MTLSDLQADVYRQLPRFHRALCSRFLVNRVVRRAVACWPIPVLEQCDAAEARVVGVHLARSVERRVKAEVGMGIILTLVLGALVQEVVKLLVRWWLERSENREAMRAIARKVGHD